MSCPSTWISKLLRLIATRYKKVFWYLLSKFGMPPSAFTELKTHSLTQPTLHQCVQDTISPELYSKYLTTSEADQIRKQFTKADNGTKLLFWTNVPRALAQAWADANGASTLSTMMGPLMEEVHVHKKAKEWSKYVKGVSCLFAELAKQRVSVLVLTTPPGIPRYRKESTFKSLEEPILKSKSSLRIDYVHPTVHGAETVEYSHWPVDSTSLWLERFGKEKPVDPMKLLKQIRSGNRHPHFSFGRLPPAQTMSEGRVSRGNCCILSKAVLDVSTLLLQLMQYIAGLIGRKAIFPIQRLLEMLKTKSHHLRRQVRCALKMILSARISFLDQSPRIAKAPQNNVATQTSQEGIVQAHIPEEPSIVQVDHTPHSQTVATAVLTKKQQKKQAKALMAMLTPIESRTEDSISAALPTPQEAQPQTQSVKVNEANRKEVTRQLGIFASLLEQHSQETSAPIKYDVQKTKSPSTTIVTLSYAGSKFKAQATGRKTARRLAAQQACQFFNIT